MPQLFIPKKINKLNNITDISFKTTKYQLEDRLRLGIEISYDEYQRVTKYHKELKRKIVQKGSNSNANSRWNE